MDSGPQACYRSEPLLAEDAFIVSTPSTWEIDISKIGRTIWARRDVFFLTVGAIFALTVVILHLVPKSYETSVSIAPVTQSNQQLSGGLSALAKLGGVNVNGLAGGGEQFRLFLSSINSQDVANQLAKDQLLMRGLFPNQWSAADRQWREPNGVVHVIAKMVKGVLGIPARPWAPPSGEDVAKILFTQIEVDEDPKSPVVTLRIQSSDPKVALQLLQELVRTIDEKLRANALRRANDYIAYLTRQLNTVSIAEYRAALTDRLSEQEQTRMMASANVSFAAQIFSGPAASTLPSAPKSILILVFSLIVGSGVGAFLAMRAHKRDWRAIKIPSRQRQAAMPPAGRTSKS